MPTMVRPNQSTLYAQADQFRDNLEAGHRAAADQMLAAWTESYQGIRQELDTLLAKVEAARAAGTPTSPAWAYQEGRLKRLLDVVAREVAAYATQASRATQGVQAAAIQAAAAQAPALMAAAAAVELPGPELSGIVAGFVAVDPAPLVATMVGFAGDGTVLTRHLAKTLTPETVDAIRRALLNGLAAGHSQAQMVRAATKGMALAHTRAVTIMRTESLRAYRETTRQSYEANDDVLAGWTWSATKDARTCLACVLMDGTQHPLTATLDGHPRCRCAMIPRTKTWAELGLDPTLDDMRPTVELGSTWLESQTSGTQEALMGPRKYAAWKAGEITLDDMVARHSDPDWGTMRTERSLVAIRAGRNANWMDEK